MGYDLCILFHKMANLCTSTTTTSTTTTSIKTTPAATALTGSCKSCKAGQWWCSHELPVPTPKVGKFKNPP